jgi:hypothetical protein
MKSRQDRNAIKKEKETGDHWDTTGRDIPSEGRYTEQYKRNTHTKGALMGGQRQMEEALVETSMDDDAKIISPAVFLLAIFLKQFC